MSWKILITARPMQTVGAAEAEALRRAGCDLTFKIAPFAEADWLAAIRGCDAAIASTEPYSARILDAPDLSNLKIISRWGVGYDAIDVAAATARGLCVAYTPGLLTEAVADYAFALLLALARGIHLGHQFIAQGEWKLSLGEDVFGKTLGIVGCGRIGLAMARRAAGFRLKLLGTDRTPNAEGAALGIHYVPLETLLAESDFVSLHIALAPETRGLIGEAQLRRMKSTALLINTSRGAVLDEPALARALRDGVIGGAALDTFVTEPLPADHEFRRTPNLLLTPHQGSFARDTALAVSRAACGAVTDLMQGRPPQWLVNPEVLASPKLRAKLPRS